MSRSPSPFLRTKLRPPRVATRLLARPRLYSILDAASEGPLTLVSAPAGYGKSTLVASWAATRQQPVAWLALDRADNSLAGFLTYFMASVRTICANACPETYSLLGLGDLPPAEEIARLMVNELDAGGIPLTLVVDDLHHIRDQDVFAFLRCVLRHPPPGFRLILIGRSDPPLPLIRLRSKGLLTEIRQDELRFLAAEEKVFFREAVGRELPAEVLESLDQALEGWAVGMHLAALSLRRHEAPNSLVDSLAARNQRVEEYLLEEVLANQPEPHKMALLRISVLDRFCPAICEALCRESQGEDSTMFSGPDFISWLDLNNLFLHSLDGEGTWYRFHHLFLELLRHNLEQSTPRGEVEALRVRAGEWFEANGHLEEALDLYLEAGRGDKAKDLVRTHRHDLMNREQWNRLESWLRRLPAEVVQKDLELEILRGYSLENRYRYREMVECLAVAEQLVSEFPDPGPTPELIGELDALLAARQIFRGDPAGAKSLSGRALVTLDPDHHSVRGFAAVVHAFAHQMTGDADLAVQLAMEAIGRRTRQGTTYHSRLLVALCFVHWFEGRPNAGLKYARELTDIGARFRLKESESFGRYFQGTFLYETGDPGAWEFLEPFTLAQTDPNLNNQNHGAFLAALIRMDNGDSLGAESILRDIADRAVRLRNPEILSLAEEFEAVFLVRMGNPRAIARWLTSYRPKPDLPHWRPCAPDLAFAMALAARGGRSDLQEARKVLDDFQDSQAALHNRRLFVESLVARAGMEWDAGETRLATDHLHQALIESAPGGLVRPFLAGGEGIATIMDRFAQSEDLRAFVGLIREQSAARNRSRGRPAAFLETEPVDLTSREREILGFLAARLSNKEIAEKLYISPVTVKRHAANIYAKLAVHRRREAVTKARTLGILPDS